MALAPHNEDPEDILSSALEALWDYQPITFSSGANSIFTISLPDDGPTITLKTPDTAAANWALHASSIWIASRFLAEHIDYLGLHEHIASNPTNRRVKMLELGASAGLPSIAVAKTHPEVSVVVTDYPDEALIATLAENVARNGVSGNCRALPFGWGTDPSELFGPDEEKFDVVVAADTLWNSEFHGIFVESLHATLKRTAQSRIHLFAGLHTGRYTIAAFLKSSITAGFAVAESTEIEVNSGLRRPWSVEREGEDEKERRKWLVWFILRWKEAI
ncbi:hypothetical protein HMN09_00689600 [Mycena chlorophos]|uniref:Nicotinamide N-methyltransferase n=1 Tax=Mycena chlorophos TaxID=658473 RepID=A0A8H6SZZ8_MYCCL|nr:hypothetical protein HMN09_00689600 [Mycena chlorophos]